MSDYKEVLYVRLKLPSLRIATTAGFDQLSKQQFIILLFC